MKLFFHWLYLKLTLLNSTAEYEHFYDKQLQIVQNLRR